MLVHFNVGNTLKLRGTPKASDTKPHNAKAWGGQVNSLGYGKNLKMPQWTIRSQGPKSKCATLTGGYGTGSETRWGWVTLKSDGLRYSPATGESLWVWVTEYKKREPAA